MSHYRGLARPHQPDWPALVANILRKGTPRRVHHLELFHDGEIVSAIAERFRLLDGVAPGDPHLEYRKRIAVYRFLGFDYVRAMPVGVDWRLPRQTTQDFGALARPNGRGYLDEHRGPITSWADFEKFPWPDPAAPAAYQELEWFEKNLPEDMCLVSGSGHFAELLTWLMGYETLCYALYEQRDLVEALAERLIQFYRRQLESLLQFSRVKLVFASDDMGFKGGLLIAPGDMRRFALRGHRILAEMAHAAGRPYLLHSCGNLAAIINDLVDDVKIDAKHSFEDTIEDVRQVKQTYGRRIALLGGVDMDFLCRADEAAIRGRVRETLARCLPGGGYCLGTGNTVANYIPLDHYLAMVDEGRLYAG